jgi:hypothetical protein
MSSNIRCSIQSALLLTTLLFSIPPAYAQSKDLFIGTWVLDADHSQFTPGPGPTDRKMIFEMKPNGLHHLTDTTGNNGGVSTIDYTAKFDGADYPIDGTAIDTVALKRTDANTIERSGKVRGMPAETCSMKVSSDGKTLTMTTKGSYRGTNYSSTQVYKRQ